MNISIPDLRWHKNNCPDIQPALVQHPGGLPGHPGNHPAHNHNRIHIHIHHSTPPHNYLHLNKYKVIKALHC